MKWSSYQEAIFDEVADGDGDIIVEARAGSGKTSSLVEALSYTGERDSCLVTAFGKENQLELERRVPHGVEALTFHSFGFRILQKALGSLKIDESKLRRMVGARYQGLSREVKTGLVHTVRACKNSMIPANPKAVHRLVHASSHIETGITLPDKLQTASIEARLDWLNKEYVTFCARAAAVLEMCKDVKDTIDFEDMIWLPNVLDLEPHFRYDWLFVDEAHDTCPAQFDLALRAVRERGRMCVLGDRFQQIYGWRGATLDALELQDAETLWLPISYRCPMKVTAIARNFANDIVSAPDAPAGNVKTVEKIQAGPGDFIISRTNAPLLHQWLKLVRADVPAKILGRDFSRGLVSFIRASKADDVVGLLAYTEKWLEAEVARLQAIRKSTDFARDRALCIEHLCEGLTTVEEVLARIEKVFTENKDKPRVLLSTVHRAKGLEADRVFLLLDTFWPWRNQEEKNILYVAVTRAKRDLLLYNRGAYDKRRKWMEPVGKPSKRSSLVLSNS